MSVNMPFGNCSKAILKLANSIQSIGVLVSIEAYSQIINICSENALEYLGISHNEILGQPATAIFGKEWIKLVKLASLDGRCQAGEYTSRLGAKLSVVGHRKEDQYILEFENKKTEDFISWNDAKKNRVC